MKITALSVICLLGITLLVLSPAPAQWVKTNGPTGGDVRALAVIGNRIFAGCGKSVYASTDYGSTWGNISKVPTGMISSFFVDGPDLYVGCEAGSDISGAFVSHDGGVTWAGLNIGLRGDIWRTTILRAGAHLFVGGQVEGNNEYYAALYRSPDQGQSWTEVYHGEKQNQVNGLFVSDSVLFMTTWGSTYRSTDNGDHWIPIDTTYWNGGSVITRCGRNLLAAAWKGFYRSPDNGATWTIIDTSQYASDVNCFATNGDMILAGTAWSGLLISTDAGSTWNLAKSGLKTHPPLSFLPYVQGAVLITAADGSPNPILLAGTMEDGVYRSTNRGGCWEQSNAGLIGTYVYAIYGDGPNLLAGTAFPSSTLGYIFRSTDKGENWVPTDSVVPEPTCFLRIGKRLFAGGPRGVYLSTDGGAQWKARNNGLLVVGSTSYYVNSLVAIGNDLAACMSSGVFLSTDFGDSWVAMNTGSQAKSFEKLILDGKYLIAGGWYGIYRSTDRGLNWTQTSVLHVYSLAVSPSGILAGTTTGVYYSSDNGASWVSRRAPPLYGQRVPFVHTVDRNLFAVAGIESVNLLYLSTDDGNSWRDVGQGLEGEFIGNLTSDNRYLYARSDGVWRRPLAEMIAGCTPLPTGLTLAQNYPNPFNSGTEIDFSLTEDCWVSLKVYNVLGQIVATVVDGPRSTGPHMVGWNANNLPSGVYLCRLQAGGLVDTKKMLLIK